MIKKVNRSPQKSRPILCQTVVHDVQCYFLLQWTLYYDFLVLPGLVKCLVKIAYI